LRDDAVDAVGRKEAVVNALLEAVGVNRIAEVEVSVAVFVRCRDLRARTLFLHLPILYLADRNFLVDDPKDKIFAPFGDARWKIQGPARLSARYDGDSVARQIFEDFAPVGILLRAASVALVHDDEVEEIGGEFLIEAGPIGVLGDGLRGLRVGSPLAFHLDDATNGTHIIEFDYITGMERELTTFPTPAELWARLRTAERLLDDATAQRLLTPANLTTGKEPRYYQQIAIHCAVRSILQGKRRVLLTMATGTGKTVVAFQICWKLW